MSAHGRHRLRLLPLLRLTAASAKRRCTDPEDGGVTSPVPALLELGPDDDLFPAWCDVWAATQLADRPGEAPRPAAEHVVLGRQLVEPGGSRDGSHRAAVVDG